MFILLSSPVDLFAQIKQVWYVYSCELSKCYSSDETVSEKSFYYLSLLLDWRALSSHKRNEFLSLCARSYSILKVSVSVKYLSVVWLISIGLQPLSQPGTLISAHRKLQYPESLFTVKTISLSVKVHSWRQSCCPQIRSLSRRSLQFYLKFIEEKLPKRVLLRVFLWISFWN